MSWHGRKCEENVAPHFCYSSCCLDLLNLNTFHRNESTGDCFKGVYIYLERCRYLDIYSVCTCNYAPSASLLTQLRELGEPAVLAGPAAAAAWWKSLRSASKYFYIANKYFYTVTVTFWRMNPDRSILCNHKKIIVYFIEIYTVHFCAVLYGSDAVFLNCKCIVYVADFTIFHPTSVTIAVFDRKSCMTFGHL